MPRRSRKPQGVRYQVSTGSPCPRPSCEARLPAGRILCADDWRVLPQRLKIAWRDARADGSPEVLADARARIVRWAGDVDGPGRRETVPLAGGNLSSAELFVQPRRAAYGAGSDAQGHSEVAR